MISGIDPAAGASPIWPTATTFPPTWSTYPTPVLADPQQIRYDPNNIYVTSNNLPSHVFGPWFDAMGAGGVFDWWPVATALRVQIPRATDFTATTATTLGVVGMWANGVAIFNTLDGASYSETATCDLGGATVSPRARHVSAASQESGPLALGSVVSAYPEFGVTLVSREVQATTDIWPTSPAAGIKVTIKDSKGSEYDAPIGYASATRVTYQMPTLAATGRATVTISDGPKKTIGNVNVVAVYPGICRATSDGLAVGQIRTVTGSGERFGSTYATTTSPVDLCYGTVSGDLAASPVDVSSGTVYLTLYGTGIRSAPLVSATIAGATATVSSFGPGASPSLDYVILMIPSSLAGKGKVEVVIYAGGARANPVYVVIR